METTKEFECNSIRPLAIVKKLRLRTFHQTLNSTRFQFSKPARASYIPLQACLKMWMARKASKVWYLCAEFQGTLPPFKIGYFLSPDSESSERGLHTFKCTNSTDRCLISLWNRRSWLANDAGDYGVQSNQSLARGFFGIWSDKHCEHLMCFQ